MSDTQFDASLDYIVQSTTQIVNNNEATEFVTTVFLVTDDQIVVHSLMAEAQYVGTDIYQILYNFGKKLAAENANPGAVFVAYEGLVLAGNENISIVGCTADGRSNAAELTLERRENSIICVVKAQVNHYVDAAQLQWTKNAALEIMRGFTEARR